MSLHAQVPGPTVRSPAHPGHATAGLAGLAAHWRTGLGAVVALPLLVLLVPRSTALIGRPFPGFLMMDDAVIASVGGTDWPPDRTRLFHAQVTSVDGEAVVSSRDVYERVAAAPTGTVFRYGLRDDGAAGTAELPSLRFSAGDWLAVYGVLLMIGACNFAPAIAVSWLQPRSRAARVYFWTTFTGGLFAILALVLHQPGYPLLSQGYFLAEAFFPATFVHLGLVFPVDRITTPARRRLAVLPYVLATVLAVGKYIGLAGQPPDLTALRLNYLFIAAAFAFFVASATQAYVANPDPLVRPRLRVVLLGIVAGSALSLTVFLDNALAGGRIPMQLGVALAPAFFLATAYAIAKHDLFEVDRFVRQGFVYGTLSAIVVGTYALVVLLPARFVPELAPWTRLPLGMAFVLVLALALDPLRRGVQHAVDRAFYRARLSYRETIEELSETLTTLLEVSEVIAQVTRVVTDTMQLESTSIAVLSDAEKGPMWTRDAAGRLTCRAGDAALAGLARELAGRGPRAAARRDDPAAGSTLATWNAALAVPLVVKERPIGLLLLGARRSGHQFDADDFALLHTLAHQTAIALHNASSYESLAALTRDLDLRVREQTNALRTSHEQLRVAYRDLERAQSQLVHSEKMTSLGQLVAGVAHEINNPASFVHGSLANLTTYLERFIAALDTIERAAAGDPGLARLLDDVRARYRLDYLVRETPQLLRICAEGSERITSIVADLRTFARAGGSDRLPVDVRDGVDSTLRLLQHRLVQGNVRVVRDYGEVPLVQASPGELNQAWMNLIANAIDATSGRTPADITIRMRRVQGDGARDWLEVSFADTGPGIDADHLERVFEPFFTTKPVGQGTGLGLSIAYGTVKSHGGDITVSSVPGTGTTFVVRLPLAPPEHGGSGVAT